MPIEVQKGETVKAEWRLQQGDIDFSARFAGVSGNPTEVEKVERLSSHSLEFVAPEDGVFSLCYDNSFSWLRRKVLEGKVKLLRAFCVCGKKP